MASIVGSIYPVTLPTTGDSGNISVTIPAGANAFVAFSVYYDNSGASVSSFTGTAITTQALRVGASSSQMGGILAWGRVNSTGASTIRMQKSGFYSEGPTLQIFWLTVADPDAFYQDDDYKFPHEGGGVINLSVTSSTTSLVLAFAGSDGGGTLGAVSGYTQSGTNQVTNSDRSQAYIANSPGASTTTFAGPNNAYPTAALISILGGPVDSTAPVLSSANATAKSNALIQAGATTDEANGTLYVVATTSSTAPSATQIRSGQTNTGSAAPFASSQVISSTGAKTFNVTGLSALTTYYIYFVHRDAAGNDSNVVSASAATFRNGATGQFILDNTGPVSGSPAGILFNDVDSGDEDKWFSFYIVTPVESGTLNINADGTFTFSGSAATSFTYQLEVDGVEIGSPVTVWLYEGGATEISSGILKRWNGSAWVAHDLKFWNGSAWVVGKLKMWNGATWIPEDPVYVTFDNTTTSELASETTKTGWAAALISAISGTLTLECKHSETADVWASGTTFFSAPLSGPLTSSAGNINGFGTVGESTIQLAADLSTGFAVLRITTNSGRWIQATLGLTGADTAFTIPSNPTTSTGFGFTSSAGILAPTHLS